MEPRLKRIMLTGASIGFGAVLALALLGGGIFWYSVRQSRPKPWNSNAIKVSGPAAFSLDDDQKLELGYVIENSTDDDYRLPDAIRTLFELNDGTLSAEVSSDVCRFSHPLFIPSKSRVNATLKISPATGVATTQLPTESEDQFHERLRGLLNDHMGNLKAVRMYDDANRYLLILPRWSSLPPQDTPLHH